MRFWWFEGGMSEVFKFVKEMIGCCDEFLLKNEKFHEIYGES